MCFSVADFFALEPCELTEIIQRRAEKIKTEHRLSFIATANAIGKMFVENYDYIDAFDSNNEGSNSVSKETYTEEEQQELLEYFSNW